jgi:hypothetical protein
MGQFHNISHEWRSIREILAFIQTLPANKKTAAIIVLSAICWSIWKHRNDVCFTGMEIN